MANMSYCRFQNTLEDLRSCYNNMDAIDDPETSPEELKAVKAIIKLCEKIADDYGDED